MMIKEAGCEEPAAVSHGGQEPFEPTGAVQGRIAKVLSRHFVESG